MMYLHLNPLPHGRSFISEISKQMTKETKMLNQRKSKRSKLFILLIVVLTMSAIYVTSVFAGEPAQTTYEDVFWYWDGVNSVGNAKLVRNDSGISADLTTTGLPAGQAVTLWAMIFNNPENCTDDPCVAPDDFFTADGDFYFVSGHVVDADGTATFGGRLNVDSLKGSGLVEFGAPGVALTNPYGAEVHLALHSHGPALTGQALKAQINSFLGGCLTFLGPNGFAVDPMYLPDAEGECATIQRSVHK
jgi:hypothetical protein